MNILLSLPSWHPGYGGPFFSVGALASALAERGHEVALLASDFPELPVQVPPDGAQLFSLKARRLPVLSASQVVGGRRAVEEVFDAFRPDVVHDNGMWLAQNHLVAACARERGVPLFHSPRGCLDPWAMRHRGWKKQIAWRLYQRRDLEAVACFHAASELEAESIRRMGMGQPIAIIPNGINIPEWAAGDRRSSFAPLRRDKWEMADGGSACGTGEGRLEIGDGRGRSLENGEHRTSNIKHRTLNSPKQKRYALFLGRLHPIKNLPTLLQAWAEVKPEGWKLKLAGSDEVGHREELEALAVDLGISEDVEFLGPVYDEAKWELIGKASLAFLISHSENFGISAAEALGCGVPVIASKTTPWACLEEENIGWWVEGTTEAVADAIREAVDLEDAEREERSQRAIRYVRESFSWDAIATQFEELYASA